MLKSRYSSFRVWRFVCYPLACILWLWDFFCVDFLGGGKSTTIITKLFIVYEYYDWNLRLEFADSYFARNQCLILQC